MDMPIFPHQQMDYVSAHSMLPATAMIEGHCQASNPDIDLTGTLIDSSNQQSNHTLANCLAASSSTATLTAAVVFSFEPQYLDVIYYLPSILFYSHTESPEIRPPLS
jgi:hypothetical protein